MHRICAVVPAYNRSRFILDALDSIEKQTRAVDEVIIVDDGSTDNTVEVVEQWRKNTSLKGGAASARNTAIRASEADLIAPLDSDDIWMPEHLELLEQPLISHADVVVVTGNTERLDDLPIFKKSAYGEELFAHMDFELGEDGFRYIAGAAFNSLLKGAFIQTSSCMFRRQPACQIWLFDQSLRSYEDQLFFLRLSKLGRFAVHMDPVTLLRRHDDNTTHRRHIASHIVCSISALEKALADADQMNLTAEELESLRAALNKKVAGAVGRASKYGIVPYLTVCRDLLSRGYAGSLWQLKPLLRALLRPRGDQVKLQQKAS